MIATARPAHLLLALTLAVVAGCGTSAPPSESVAGTPTGGPALAGSAWNLVGTGADPTGLRANNMTLEFAATTATGAGAVGPYTADYQASDTGSLQFSNIRGGQGGAADGAGQAQAHYLETLQSVTGFSRTARELDLFVSDELVYRYVPQ